MQHRGAQDPRYIRNPDAAEYNEILSKYDFIRRWSVAPELDGALELGKVLAARNIIASIAHTDALYDDVINAMETDTVLLHIYILQ
jgi:N-acetylglucosamine-6-phosphate deacetylase